MGEQKEDDIEENDETDDSLPTPPDGGWGWAICASSFMVHFIADGLAFSFGVLYVELLEYFNESRGKTAWIGSLFIGVPLLAGPIAGSLTNRFGCRIVTIGGGVVTTLGLVGSFFSDSVEMLCFFFGIVAGLGLACVYVPAVVIVAFYFDSKRALATGIAVSGSGIGTFVFAPLTEYLLNMYGWRGTVLIMGGVVLNICVFGALYRPLESPLEVKKRKYIKSLAKFSEIVAQKRAQNGHIAGRHLELEKHHVFSRSMQDFPTCINKQEHSLRKEVLSATASNAHVPNLEKDGETRSSYSVIPINNKEKQVVENRHTLVPMERKDIFYRGSILRLNIPNHLAKSCPALNTEPATVAKDSAKESSKACGCLKKITPDTFKRMLGVSLFKNVVFVLFFFSNFLLYMWNDIPYIYLSDQALLLGIPASHASFLISILGIVSTIGQLVYGYLGDLKQVNTVLLYSFSTCICGIGLTLLPFATMYELICVFCVVFGFCLSANYTLETIVIVELLGLDQLTNAYGLVMCGQGIANLVGPPIGGWLCDYTGNYDLSFYVSGVGIIISGIMVFLMHLVLRKREQHSKSKELKTTVVEHVVADNVEKDTMEHAAFL